MSKEGPAASGECCATDEFAIVENYFCKGKYADGLAKGQKANLRRKCKSNFKFERGILYHRKAEDGKRAAEGPFTDQHINAAHTLLRRQFPSLDGLQSLLLQQNGSFKPISQIAGSPADG